LLTAAGELSRAVSPDSLVRSRSLPRMCYSVSRGGVSPIRPDEFASAEDIERGVVLYWCLRAALARAGLSESTLEPSF